MKFRKLNTILLLIVFTACTAFGTDIALFRKTHAQSENNTSTPTSPFVINYNVTYDIQNSGEAFIAQNITIENLEKDVVATNYTLTLKKLEIYDLAVESKNGSVDLEEIRNSDQTDIHVEFRDAVIGEGRKNEFTISYKTKDVTSKIGEVWNLNIPKVNLLPDTKQYLVTVSVPESFGPEIFVSPQPLLKENTNSKHKYVFNKNTLINSGITASFGQYQILNFKLDYELYNPSNFSTKQAITLPPDLRDIQQISYKSLEPQPQRLYRDEDGNVLAEYSLSGKETKKITLVGTARILSRQIKPEFGGKKDNIRSELVKAYTLSNEYWNAEDAEVKKIAQTLYDPSKTVTENAQNAYYFVTDNLEYDFNIVSQEYVDRKGGKAALLDKQGIGCREFTDLFISIARAMGIPARELNGFAIADGDSTNTPLSINLKGGDVLHSWAEFYDPEFGWVPVDPTWGSTSDIDYFTKLDTNHLVFVVKGQDPNFPLPAGAFKTGDSARQVQVDFANAIETSDFEPRVSLYNASDTNLARLLGLKDEKKYYLRNEGKILVSYDGMDILPTQHAAIALNENVKILSLKDTLGKDYLVTPEIKEENLDKPVSKLVIIILLVPVLYTIYHISANRLRNRKKGFPLLGRLLRDRDR